MLHYSVFECKTASSRTSVFIVGLIVGIVHSVVRKIWSRKLTNQGEQQKTTALRNDTIFFGVTEPLIKYNAECPMLNSTMPLMAAGSRPSEIPVIRSEQRTQELGLGVFLQPMGTTILVRLDNSLGFHFHKIITPY
jgi:hypothetical protein